VRKCRTELLARHVNTPKQAAATSGVNIHELENIKSHRTRVH